MIETDIELLRKLIAYNPENGKMTWLPRDESYFSPNGQLVSRSISKSFNTRFSGKPALDCLDRKTGYLCGNIFARRHQAHRVLWALVFGEWPPFDIDHINGNRADNRIVNLRAVTRSGNCKNMKKAKNNTSGYTGVYWASDRGKWRAEIASDGVKVKLGAFFTLEEAIAAREKAAIELGFHENHGMR